MGLETLTYTDVHSLEISSKKNMHETTTATEKCHFASNVKHYSFATAYLYMNYFCCEKLMLATYQPGLFAKLINILWGGKVGDVFNPRVLQPLILKTWDVWIAAVSPMQIDGLCHQDRYVHRFYQWKCTSRPGSKP